MNGKKNHLFNGINKELQNYPEFIRSGSRDNVRKIVEKEGKIARNLVAWSVPSETDQRPPQRQRGRPKNRTKNDSIQNSSGGKRKSVNSNNKSTNKKTPQQKVNGGFSKQTNTNKKELKLTSENVKAFEDGEDLIIEEPVLAERRGSTTSRETKTEQYQERIRIAIEKGSEEAKPSQRPSSAASFASQKNLRARYWSYLFDNFHRAVDEIYLTCENDESVLECQEVIMMLDVCKKDFAGLIHRLELFNQLETSNVRPQSLAWEVRKQMSPGKCSPTVSSRRSPSPGAVRFLSFNQQNLAPFSWADRVRGFSNQPSDKKFSSKDLSLPTSNCLNNTSKQNFPSPVHEVPIEEHSTNENDDDDEEGWEVVKKGRSRSKGSNLSTSSGSSLQNHSKKQVVTSGNTTTSPVFIKSETKKCVINQSNPKNSTNDKNSTVNKNDSKTTENQNNEHLEEKVDKNGTVVKPNAFNEDNRMPDKQELTENEENGDDEKTSGSLRLENLSRSSTIIEEYFDYNIVTDHDVTESLMKSTSSFNMETIDLAFNLTEDELQMKEEQEKALASAIAEEETLTKELEEEALKDDDQDDDISSDRDYTISDGRETPKDLSDELPLDSSTSFDEAERAITWEEMCQQYDKEHDQAATLEWGDMMELSESVRMPGRALEMHQKLSSPSRRKSRSESVKRSEERMVRTERRRLRFLVEKCERLRILSERVRKVRELKNTLIHEKEQSMLDQMKRAELNRKIMLQEKVKKAQEEELKVNEIAFINSLEAQNKRIEVQEKHQISEARLHDLMEERQRRKVDKQAKEEAAQERRKQLEQERLARLQEIKQKRGNQAAKWQKERIEKERAREELAKERQRNREMKVAARDEALQQATEELQKRIVQKHIESTKRHEQKLTEVKEKSRAASSSRHSTVEETPSAVPYDKGKKCTLCDVEIVSDVYMVSHLKGNKHKNVVKEINKKITDAEMEAFSSKYIKEVDANNNQKKQQQKDELDKVYKKKSKKLKTRMTNKGKEFESTFMTTMIFVESTKRGRLQKSIKEIMKVLQGHTNGAWAAKKVATLDKSLSEICRTIDSGEIIDKRMFCQLGGLSTLCRVLLLYDISTTEKSAQKVVIPVKLVMHTVDTMSVVCNECVENCQYVLLSNKLEILVNILAFLIKLSAVDATTCSPQKEKNDNTNQLTSSIPANESRVHHMLIDHTDSQLVIALMKTIKIVLSAFCPKWPHVGKDKTEQLDLQQRVVDVASYMVCERIIENLVDIYRSIQGALDDNELSCNLQEYVSFLQPVVFGIARLEKIFTPKKDEIVLFSQVITRTELCGLVALMYSLLHQGSSTRIAPSPLPLADSTVVLLITIFKTLNTLALVDLVSFQKAVAGEGTSLQYRSVTTYLLRYISNEKSDDLLHEVIFNIGYFTVINEENQIFIQTGRAPSLIQQLCMLPFGYFSDPRLKDILFPTLISACFKNNENKEMLAQDVNPSILALYLDEKMNEPVRSSKIIDSIEQRSDLMLRFPKTLLDEARQYFGEKTMPEAVVSVVEIVNSSQQPIEIENYSNSKEILGEEKNGTMTDLSDVVTDICDMAEKSDVIGGCQNEPTNSNGQETRKVDNVIESSDRIVNNNNNQSLEGSR